MRQSMKFSTLLMLVSTAATIYMVIADSKVASLIASTLSSAASH